MSDEQWIDDFRALNDPTRRRELERRGIAGPGNRHQFRVVALRQINGVVPSRLGGRPDNGLRPLHRRRRPLSEG